MPFAKPKYSTCELHIARNKRSRAIVIWIVPWGEVYCNFRFSPLMLAFSRNKTAVTGTYQLQPNSIHPALLIFSLLLSVWLAEIITDR